MSPNPEGIQSQNLILAAIPPEEFAAFQDLLEAYPLRLRENLQEAGEEPEFVYFPTRGIISTLTVLENGMMMEFATIGREGCTGVPVVLGVQHSTITAISQLPGLALRMRSKDFTRLLKESPAFAAAMTCYGGVLFALLAQSAACNRAHHVDQRCARWLLMTLDQAGTNEFPITQEFLAQMLGVSRPSVAGSAAALQRAGLISYHRGDMTIVDREGLEAASCECYRAVVKQFDRLRQLRQY